MGKSSKTSSSCSHLVKKSRRPCCCESSCPSRDSHDSSRSCCGSLSCLKECGKDECMLVRQFLDFNPTGAVYVNRIIPVPCCQEIDGLKGSKNRLGMKFSEFKPPFFVEVAREHPGRQGGGDQLCSSSQSSCYSSSKSVKKSAKSCSCSLCHSKSPKKQ